MEKGVVVRPNILSKIITLRKGTVVHSVMPSNLSNPHIHDEGLCTNHVDKEGEGCQNVHICVRMGGGSKT